VSHTGERPWRHYHRYATPWRCGSSLASRPYRLSLSWRALLATGVGAVKRSRPRVLTLGCSTRCPRRRHQPPLGSPVFTWIFPVDLIHIGGGWLKSRQRSFGLPTTGKFLGKSGFPIASRMDNVHSRSASLLAWPRKRPQQALRATTARRRGSCGAQHNVLLAHARAVPVCARARPINRSTSATRRSANRLPSRPRNDPKTPALQQDAPHGRLPYASRLDNVELVRISGVLG